MAAERKHQWYPDVWLLQETLPLTKERRRLLGCLGTTVAACPLDGRGLAVVASPLFDVQFVESDRVTLGSNAVEYLCVDVSSARDAPFRLLNVYLRPGPQIDWTAFFAEIVTPLAPDVVGGDFNARHESWDEGVRSNARDTFARGDALLHAAQYARVALSSSGLSKVSTTRRGSAVDMFLFSETVIWFPHEVHCEVAHPSLQPLTGALSDHFPVVISVPSLGRAKRARRTRQLCWDRILPAHRAAFRHHLRTVGDNPQRLHDKLCGVVRHLPRSSWNAPCMSPFTLQEDYYDATSAWRAVRQLRTFVPPTVPLQLAEDAPLIFGARQKAIELNRLFSSKHSAPVSLRLPAYTPRDPASPSDCPDVTLWEVRRTIRNLKPTGAADNDGISPRLLQWCPEQLSVCLRPVFTAILREPSRIPEAWKSSVLVPLPKEGKPPHLLTSHRPICIYSLLSRLLESVVAARIQYVTSRSPSYDKDQYGFRPGYSPADAVGALLGTALLVCDTTRNARSSRDGTRSTRWGTRVPGRCLVGYLDLSDAFCRVPHVTLLSELSALSVPLYLIEFVRAWLSRRRARTFFQGRYSSWADLEAGVPQGSVLGPLLFTIFINRLVATVNGYISRPPVPLTHMIARVVAYVDDITVLIGGYDVAVMVNHMERLLKRILAWCATNNMVLSPKSVFQWLASAHLGLEVLRRGEAQSQGLLQLTVDLPPDPTAVRPSAMEPAPLTVRRGRLLFGTPVPQMSFPIAIEGFQRFLGVQVDCGLNFSAHVADRTVAGAMFLTKLEPVLRRCHPRVGRSLAFAVAGMLTYGLPLLNSQLERVLDLRMKQLNTVWHHALRLAGHITRTAASADTLLEMACPTLEMIVTKQAIAYNRRRNTHPRVESALYAILDPDPPGTYQRTRQGPTLARRLFTHIDQLRRPIDPFVAFGHRPVADLMPFRHPPSPPPSACDRVQFLIPDGFLPPRNVRQRLESNRRIRLQANALLAGCHTIEGWSDGGYSCSGPPEHRVEHAGGAAVVFQSGESHARIRSQCLAPAPPLACSYTAEIAGALALFPLLLDAVVQDAAAHPHIGILVCADSRSWVEHVGKGPQNPGPIAPLLWSVIAPLAERVDLVIIAHMYAHCDDPRGDVVDAAATQSRDLDIRQGSAWDTDSTRHAWAPHARLLTAQLKSARSTYHKLVGAPIQGWFPSPTRLPPIRLRVRQASMILQLRTGYWPSLGAHTFIRSYAQDWTCPWCGQLVSFVSGGGVRHILICPTPPAHRAMSSDLLWSPSPSVLRKVIVRSAQWGHRTRSRSPSESSAFSLQDAGQ